MKYLHLYVRTIVVLIIFLILLSPPIIHAEEDANCLLVKRLFTEVYNHRNLNLLNDLVAVDYVEQMNGVESDGVISIIKTVQWLEDIAPNFKLTIEDLICKNDKVVVRWTYEGTNIQYNKVVKLDGMYIAQITEGKVTKGWQVFDNYQRYMQLGYSLIAPDETQDVEEHE